METAAIEIESLDTCVVTAVRPSEYEIRSDATGQLKIVDHTAIHALPWKGRRRSGSFLFVEKAHSPRPLMKRVLRVYACRVHEDGSLGRRELVRHVVDGKLRELRGAK
jgi:hypothetical protein